ncbi:hypothetical protein LX32DRAFT_405827 [Colletotrichum zoysiae]|uniref:Uncharacterized protein n=1 Tax=Colletotrichum zoysiae TaxID=1216348 RepID=A0AAD9HHH4_9PEZI|nr:hypothetical protein LX32DRAFT_405827 [Colletotrichum zoysiae]
MATALPVSAVAVALCARFGMNKVMSSRKRCQEWSIQDAQIHPSIRTYVLRAARGRQMLKLWRKASSPSICTEACRYPIHCIAMLAQSMLTTASLGPINWSTYVLMSPYLHTIECPVLSSPSSGPRTVYRRQPPYREMWERIPVQRICLPNGSSVQRGNQSRKEKRRIFSSLKNQ